MKKLLLLLPLLSALTTVGVYSQELYNKEILWSVSSAEIPVFENKEQVMEWVQGSSGHEFVRSKEFHIQDNNVLIFMVERCSGLHCMTICVFKETEEGLWSFVTASSKVVYLRGYFNVKADDDEQVLLFEDDSKVIGKIAYEYLKK